jgi:hypothetical protein
LKLWSAVSNDQYQVAQEPFSMFFPPKTLGNTCAPPSPGRLKPKKQLINVSMARNGSSKDMIVI